MHVAVILGLLLTVAEAGAARLQVCGFSFHGPAELQVFKDRLPPEEFDVIDLSPHRLPPGAPPPPATDGRAPAAPWLFDLCRAEIRCDVVVFSAEFAGSFFGSYGKALGLADMEEASCQPRCDGLFHHPQEVFLLGCNTLATKATDRRTPAEYLQVLVDHGFDRATAERVVSTRYGPLGPSFRESLRRIFMGVPRLYGFSSVAPSGEYTGPMLERYFRAKGDYREYLERSAGDTGRNAQLLAAFRGTGLVQETGFTPDEPAAADRDLICRLHDERLSVAARLRIIDGLMDREDVMSFVPTFQLFMERHPPARFTGEDARLFDDVRDSDAARERILALVHELDVSALQLELAHFARHLGWMDAGEFRALAVSAAHELLARPLTSDVVDVMCEIPRHESLSEEFTLDDLPSVLFTDAEGIRMVECLALSDPRVTVRLTACLDLPDLTARLWAAYALSRRLPLPDATLVRLAADLDDPSPDLRDRAQWIFRVQLPRSADVVAAVAAHHPGLATMLAPRPRRRGGWLW